jgi:hypothetical protein
MNTALATTRNAAFFAAAAAAALSLALAAPAYAVEPGHLPGAATNPATTGPSADSHLQAIVAGYTRATLDRGGWHNSFAAATTGYAAGEPLLAAEVGNGVTTPGADHQPQHPRIAAR